MKAGNGVDGTASCLHTVSFALPRHLQIQNFPSHLLDNHDGGSVFSFP